MIQRAIQRQGQIEYFHQTLGYIFEVLETVYGEPKRLESALESYQKAHFLNDPTDNPENAADLLLNLGNVYFLLGQYGKAFVFYSKRFESGIPFDREETEILFYRRFGAAAFQVKDHAYAIQAFGKTLELIEKRINPRRASEIMGRINRTIVDRVITPALGEPSLANRAKELAARQARLNQKLYDVSGNRVAPPPDPGWKAYRKVLESLILEQREIIRAAISLVQGDQEQYMPSLLYMIVRARDALHFPERLMQLKAEMLDRLGLAYQEAEKWQQARETFEQAFKLNRSLGLFHNLASNRRSIAFNVYMEAGTRSGKERRRLLDRFYDLLERHIIPSYHNTMGVLALSRSGEDSTDRVERAARGMKAFEWAVKHSNKGLAYLEKHGRSDDREVLALWAGLYLNMAELAFACGEVSRARGHLEQSLEIARRGLFPEYAWRALVGLGRLKEGLSVLESVSILRSRCGPSCLLSGS